MLVHINSIELSFGEMWSRMYLRLVSYIMAYVVYWSFDICNHDYRRYIYGHCIGMPRLYCTMVTTCVLFDKWIILIWRDHIWCKCFICEYTIYKLYLYVYIYHVFVVHYINIFPEYTYMVQFLLISLFLLLDLHLLI